MLIDESIINPHFEPLNSTDTVETVEERMEEKQVTTLPVVNEATEKLVGEVQYVQLRNQDDQTPVSGLELNEAVKIYRGQHVFEAARLLLQYELKLLPVVDEEWSFLGILTKKEVLKSLSRMLNLAKAGSVITVELDPVDLSLSEMVQIIETEEAKILGLTVDTPGSTEEKIEVSLKLNVKDLSRVTAALRRYDYNVITPSGSTVFEEDLEERADELLNYIDM